MLTIGTVGWCGDTLSIEKALFRRNIGRPVVSPDGKKAVVTVSVSGAPADSLATHIWLLDLQTKVFRQFTNSTKSEMIPSGPLTGGSWHLYPRVAVRRRSI